MPAVNSRSADKRPTLEAPTSPSHKPSVPDIPPGHPLAGRGTTSGPVRKLIDLAYARSGDKGTSANIGVIARRLADYARLCREITAERVAAYLGIEDSSRVTRFELSSLSALNFIVRGILASSLRTDAQGKALGQVLLQMPLGET